MEMKLRFQTQAFEVNSVSTGQNNRINRTYYSHTSKTNRKSKSRNNNSSSEETCQVPTSPLVASFVLLFWQGNGAWRR